MASIEATLPQKLISAKQMKNFKLDFTNELRSMCLDGLLEDDYTPSKEGDPYYGSYVQDNKFLYSCIMKAIKGYEVREWLTTYGVINDGIKGWQCIMNQYDLKELQGAHLSDAME